MGPSKKSTMESNFELARILSNEGLPNAMYFASTDLIMANHCKYPEWREFHTIKASTIWS